MVRGMKGGARERCCVLFRGSVVEMSCVGSGEQGFLQASRAMDLCRLLELKSGVEEEEPSGGLGGLAVPLSPQRWRE